MTAGVPSMKMTTSFVLVLITVRPILTTFNNIQNPFYFPANNLSNSHNPLFVLQLLSFKVNSDCFKWDADTCSLLCDHTEVKSDKYGIDF